MKSQRSVGEATRLVNEGLEEAHMYLLNLPLIIVNKWISSGCDFLQYHNKEFNGENNNFFAGFLHILRCCPAPGLSQKFFFFFIRMSSEIFTLRKSLESEVVNIDVEMLNARAQGLRSRHLLCVS